MTHLEACKKRLRQAGADALIVSSKVGQRYLSDFNYDDGYILVTPDKSYLLTDFRYIEAANAHVNGAEFEVLAPKGGMLAEIASRLRTNNAKTVLFEEEEMTYGLYETFRDALPGCNLQKGGSALLVSLRLYKDEEEIARIRKAQAITDETFSYILTFIKPEMTELEVALEMEFHMRSLGSEGVAFDTIAVSGTNSSRPHGVPRNVRLENGFFTMDFGARFDGYDSDMTRTVVLGKADAEMKKLYQTVRNAQTAAIEALHVGINCRQADRIARDLIDGAGYAGCFGHGLGHGVGMYIHESPRFSPAAPADQVLEVGHVVTVEPGIYLAGKYGCRIEDMIYVHADGTVEDLTHSPKDLIELF